MKIKQFWFYVGHALLIVVLLLCALIWCSIFYGLWSDDPAIKDNLAETVMLAGLSVPVCIAGGLSLIHFCKD